MKAHKLLKKRQAQSLKRQHFFRSRQREKGLKTFRPQLMTKSHQQLNELCRLLGKSQAEVITDAVRYFEDTAIKPAKIATESGAITFSRINVWLCPTVVETIGKMGFRDAYEATDALIDAYHSICVWK